MIAQCGVANLVSDSRFLNETALRGFFTSLLAAAEGGRSFERASDTSTSVSTSTPLAAALAAELQEDVGNDVSKLMARLQELLLKQYTSLPTASAASTAWLEILVVETSLRNRDRFALLWPDLSQHYHRCISPLTVYYPPEQANHILTEGNEGHYLLSYAAER